jgi:hypothetical protein
MNAAPELAPPPITPPPKQKNGLAIVGVVFASLFFIPLLPLVGLIIGIVVLATGRHKTLGIVAICLGAFFTLFLGVEAAIAIPAFVKYVRRAKSVEATMNLRRIGENVMMLDAAKWAALPDSEWTPRDGACSYPKARHPVDASQWSVEPWKTIGFSVDDPSYYQYRLRRTSQGFVVEAQADLDCNGKFGHVSREITPSGVGELVGTDALE